MIILGDTSCVDTCYPDHSLEELVRNKVSETTVRLTNGSSPLEGFIQLKKDDKWVDICYANVHVCNLVCQELGYHSGRLVRGVTAFYRKLNSDACQFCAFH